MVNMNLQPSAVTEKPVTTTEGGKPGSNPIVETSPKMMDPNTLYLDSDKGVYMKNGKPFTGKENGVTYKKGKATEGNPSKDILAISEPKPDKPTRGTTAKPKDPTVVYSDPEKGLFMKNGKPFTGENNGETYVNGKPKKGGFTQAGTKYEADAGKKDPPVAYLLHIYYDFDQSTLRDESMPELDKLLKLMKDNPSQIVEIASHTDARGSNGYNNRLSQRRAESVVRWLIDKGVERDRLVPRGYGETMTSNDCKNQIKCTEEEHQLNRRTEFRVLGCKDCVDKDKVKMSQPKINPKVDKCHGCPF